MKNARWSPIFAAILLAAGITAHPPAGVRAQSNDPGVAFVSTLNGDVTVQRGDSGDVEAAGVNAPLMVGDYVSTGPDSRAEVQFDYGHAVRVGPNSQLRFAELGRRDDTVQLAAGTVGIGVVHATAQYTQVQTPSVTVRPREAGFYRVAIESDGTTAITVRSGTAAILLPQGTRSLDPGSTMLVWGPADNPSFRYVQTVGHDSFDQWNTDRDAAFARSDAYRYAAPSIPGLYDLSAYGQWQSSPQYGYEWLPNVPSGWTPYSTGQWTSEPYYGWTWVDNAPWGYAPSHYGRWYRDQHRNRWAWTPGPRYQTQASWSPALVAFIGFGGGGGLSISVIDNIGWVALAPSEQPHPWWGTSSTTYATTNVTNIQNVYVNSRWPSAVRGMPRQEFAAGQYQNAAPVSTAYLNRAVVMRSALPVVPAAQALRYTQRAAVTAHAPSAQAFHAFAATPRAPQTFAQQRTNATTVAQHAATVHSQPATHPQAALHPQQPAVVHQPQTAVHPQPAVVHQPQTAVHPQPAVVHHPQTAVHPQPAVVHHPQTAVHPQQPAVVHQPQTAVHPQQPAVVHHPQTAVHPQQPAVVHQPQTAVHPQQPAVVHQPQTAVHPQQPAVMHHPQTAVHPQQPPVMHPQTAVHPQQPVHQAAVRPQPGVVHPPQTVAHPQPAAQQKHPQPVVQAPRGSADQGTQHPPQ